MVELKAKPERVLAAYILYIVSVGPAFGSQIKVEGQTKRASSKRLGQILAPVPESSARSPARFPGASGLLSVRRRG